MRSRYTVLLASVGSLGCFAQTPILHWGHALSGPGNTTNMINSCSGSVTDPDGNVYTVGEFANNLDLDPGLGAALVASASLMDFDLFLAKSHRTAGCHALRPYR